MQRLLVILSLLLSLNASAQSYATVPDSLDLVEYHEHVTLFADALTFGRTIGNLYVAGDGLSDVRLEVLEGRTEVETSEENHRLSFSYIKEPTMLFTYGPHRYELRVRLVYTDWPGNEINWRMIPRIYFTPAP